MCSALVWTIHTWALGFGTLWEKGIPEVTGVLSGDRHSVVAAGQDPPKAGALLPGHPSHIVSCFPLLFSSRDDVIGKVCITRAMLAEHPKGRGQRGWGVPPLGQAGPEGLPSAPFTGIPLFPQDTVAG